jgi:hypothetical protein
MNDQTSKQTNKFAKYVDEMNNLKENILIFMRFILSDHQVIHQISKAIRITIAKIALI